MSEAQEIIVAGEQIKAMMDTQGWKKHAEPLLDKMIRDVIGGKEAGRWDNGSCGEKNITDFDLQQLIAYKAALVNFHTAVYQFIDDMETTKIALRDENENKKYNSDYEPGVD